MNRWTIRVRLTVLYGGLFFLAGAVLLGVTYLLMAQRLDRNLGSRADIGIRQDQVRELFPNNAAMAQAVQHALAERDRVRDDALNSLLTQGGIALLGVGVVAGAFGWLVAGRALQPLHRITDTARRIAGADGARTGLHERIALKGPRDEVKELADTFDVMLERLDRSFDGQRRFVANASHELRTPLALNRALVELAVTRPGAATETKQLGESLLTVNERHERLIDGLLTLADAENEVADRSPLDLYEVAEHVLDQLKTAELEVLRQLAPAPTRGDPILLERLVQNLVENATRHNTPGGWLAVTTQAVNGWAVLTVTNTGPVVPPYEIEALFQPFRRLGRERIDGGRGFGLGLSIVRAVATAHGGTVRATPREGGGLVVQVTLPAN
ncbi:HAMP domain-containing sensor histidine kinase [Phytohabitans sp. ZYX-F-186]|uniref:histidine kinase n=1 Tax=Phytohabitans maris TaxID=3071409 RepID=A0ABU0ZII0_9ACTN|nr:HAMP domain-containing sensor histidine kinase [Phytohabitans sp. ZYX-F-186]MDQ7906837.1 HAMP domain-containing sensor histidine kinase [Phytohabitans sp. ZYX-F-186]